MFLATPVPRENLGQALCGVVPSTVALGLAPVEDDAQTLEDPAGGFGLHEPLRTQDREDVGARDGVHALGAERPNRSRERRKPLLAVFFVSKARRVGGMNLSGGCLETRDVTALTATLVKGVASSSRYFT